MRRLGQAGLLTTAEARSNVIAAYISAGRARDVPSLLASLGMSAESCFEAAFNVGCAKLAQGQLSEAQELLMLSNRMGREALLDEEYAEEDIEKELLPSACLCVGGLRACADALALPRSPGSACLRGVPARSHKGGCRDVRTPAQAQAFRCGVGCRCGKQSRGSAWGARAL